jgi:hypothetical protein
MRNRSPANSADSSPPVPADLFQQTHPRVVGVLGISISCRGPSICAIKCILAAAFLFGHLLHVGRLLSSSSCSLTGNPLPGW